MYVCQQNEDALVPVPLLIHCRLTLVCTLLDDVSRDLLNASETKHVLDITYLLI